MSLFGCKNFKFIVFIFCELFEDHSFMLKPWLLVPRLRPLGNRVCNKGIQGQTGTSTAHEGRIPCDPKHTNWHATSASQGVSGMSKAPPEGRGEAQNSFSLRAPKGTSPADSLILHFQLTELWDTHFCHLNCPVRGTLWQSPSKLMQQVCSCHVDKDTLGCELMISVLLSM